jgi:AcrR family transcriptional regulator
VSSDSPSRRDDRRARAFLEREQAILAAALTLFGGDDWPGVTIDRIAAAAEVAKGTLYKHFASKDDLMGRLALDYRAGLLTALRRVPAAADPLAHLRALLAALLQYHAQHRSHRNVMLYTMAADFPDRLSPALRRQMLEQRGAVVEPLRVALQQAIDARLVADAPIDALMAAPNATINGALLALWTGQVGAAQAPAYVARVIDFIVQGLAAPTRPA